MLHVHILHVISADFNLDFYTEVQDLSYLENLLSQQSPRYAALNMEICSLIEDFGLVGFETLAVEVRVRILYTLDFQWIPKSWSKTSFVSALARDVKGAMEAVHKSLHAVLAKTRSICGSGSTQRFRLHEFPIPASTWATVNSYFFCSKSFG